MVLISLIVTDYRLNANHNCVYFQLKRAFIVTDYRLNANHNKARLSLRSL
ncbi:Helicase loader DnaI [bacterium endosymbiont of Bathymodiolus sp. 5 South]|nr:Helicase loader DnaI [bacterium endosymbiont of Bathymodiolus sp. 5 South]